MVPSPMSPHAHHARIPMGFADKVWPEAVSRSQSEIVVRDDLGVLEIFAHQVESKAETAHELCGLAQNLGRFTPSLA